ncbi:hypothetical protein WR25_13194 [Diploscapter pachys]|uniref:Uncharacterized protein n=1 Tax=Diploscapter pachys TaxID=2018661 RepID=A0A2A2M1G4_9BILA|nr:hypothetical protein WR25_13194 [Diploscapter pachys]
MIAAKWRRNAVRSNATVASCPLQRKRKKGERPDCESGKGSVISSEEEKRRTILNGKHEERNQIKRIGKMRRKEEGSDETKGDRNDEIMQCTQRHVEALLIKVITAH